MKNSYVFLLFGAFDDDAEAGVRQSELIGWYLNQIQDELESEEELLNKKVLVEKVIERLIRHVTRK